MKNLIYLSPLLALLLLNSCSASKELKQLQDEALEMNKNQSALSQLTIDQLEVIDGFNYLDDRAVELDLNFISKGQTTVGYLQVDIAGLSGKVAERFFSGMTDRSGRLHIDLEVPDRYRNLLITAKFRGKEKQFRAPIRPMIQQQVALP
ncbi:MAG: hypothetical protein AAGG75_25400 [Bacteroidota bacterium]